MHEPFSSTPAIPAATVVVVRDAAGGVEVLMGRRNARGRFGGLWVFPGGRIDPHDWPAGVPPETAPTAGERDHPDYVLAARRAAVREATEEAALALDGQALVPFSFWTPPAIHEKRFNTWFFVTEAPDASGADVQVDGTEILEHAWVKPAELLEQRDSGVLSMVPPTWITLWRLHRYASVTETLDHSRTLGFERYTTRPVREPSGDGTLALYEGDVGWETWDPDVRGPRHRLHMSDRRWTYERELGSLGLVS